jgi:hypothetical protein
MNRGKLTFLLAFVLALLLMSWGCSGGGGAGTVLPEPVAPKTIENNGGTGLWGLYQVSIDPKTESVDIVQLRGAEDILNVVGFLEPPALSGMTIDFDTLVIADPMVLVDVILTHPLDTPDEVFHGFDVRGICIGPKLINADGLTPAMNPADFELVPFGYQDGLLGAPYSYAGYDGLWGYKYFCDGLLLNDDVAEFFNDPLNLDNRGIFSEGMTNVRHYDLTWEGSPHAFLVFNYAIYACYEWPIGDPPYEIDDYQITAANSMEAFCGSFTEINNTLYYSDGTGGGGNISLDVEVWDWQGLASSEVTIEAPIAGINPTLPDSDEPGHTAYSTLYHWVDLAATPVSTGDLDLIVKVTDTMTFGESWFLDLLDPGHAMYDELVYNCFVHTTQVSECPAPEVLGINPDNGAAGDLVSVTISGNYFVDGSMLATKLQMTGQSDIDGTNVVFVDEHTITCDFDLTGAFGGDWDVTVVNGCGAEGTLPGGFAISGGLTLKDHGTLPDTDPIADEINFCVVGDDGLGFDGVYFFGANYDVRYYPLDYSAVSQSYMVLQGNYGYSIGQWLGAPTDVGPLELDATGGLIVVSRGTGAFFGGYTQNQCMTWWGPSNPVGQNGLTLNGLYGTVYTRDCEAEFDAYGWLWGLWNCTQDNGYAGNDVEIVMVGISYSYGSGSYSAGWNINWGPLDEVSGSVDGEVSNSDTYRYATDTDPEGLTGGLNKISYYLEGAPDDNDIEIFNQNRSAPSATSPHAVIQSTEFQGTAIDVCVWRCFGEITMATGNWLVVLEDNGDSTWQIALFDQDGTLIVRGPTQDGDALGVDCDNEPGTDDGIEIHVWADNAGTLEYTTFVWT